MRKMRKMKKFPGCYNYFLTKKGKIKPIEMPMSFLEFLPWFVHKILKANPGGYAAKRFKAEIKFCVEDNHERSELI